MAFNCGIIGLPNVGKSTLFNALTRKNIAQAENYPFCTIEPNIAEVNVPDQRLEKLASVDKPKITIPARVKFIDIAGLVKGAANGEGLGNQFLAHIKNTQAVFHLVRCYQDHDIVHVKNDINPIDDIETVNTELMLADLQTLENIITKIDKKKHLTENLPMLEAAKIAYQHIKNGDMAITCHKPENLLEQFKQMQLLTDKKVIYLANIDEKSIKNGNSFSQELKKFAEKQNTISLNIAAKIEADLAELDKNDYQNYLNAYGVEESGLERIINNAYQLLGLITFFTSGPKETRAWTVEKNIVAPSAAGKIHTDFEKGFIRAEIIDYQGYIKCNGALNAKKLGKMRLEGKDYIVQDGDVINFLHAN